MAGQLVHSQGAPQTASPMLGAPRHDRIQVRSPTPARRARLYPSGHRRGGAGCARGDADRAGLYRLRRDRAVAPCRQPRADHAAAADAAGRAQADRADGRRHVEDRRSELQGRGAQAAHRRGDRRQHRLDPARVRALPDLRRRPDRRGDGRQCRLARRARIYPLPARGRAAFLGQPDAELRQREAAARPRAIAELPRIQLHDPSGL